MKTDRKPSDYSAAELESAINFALRTIQRYCPSDRRFVQQGKMDLSEAMRRSRLIFSPLPEEEAESSLPPI